MGTGRYTYTLEKEPRSRLVAASHRNNEAIRRYRARITSVSYCSALEARKSPAFVSSRFSRMNFHRFEKTPGALHHSIIPVLVKMFLPRLTRLLCDAKFEADFYAKRI